MRSAIDDAQCSVAVPERRRLACFHRFAQTEFREDTGLGAGAETRNGDLGSVTQAQTGAVFGLQTGLRRGW